MVYDPQRGCVCGRDHSPTIVEEVRRLREKVRILKAELAAERKGTDEIRDDAERRMRIRQEQLEAAISNSEYFEKLLDCLTRMVQGLAEPPRINLEMRARALANHAHHESFYRWLEANADG